MISYSATIDDLTYLISESDIEDHMGVMEWSTESKSQSNLSSYLFSRLLLY